LRSKNEKVDSSALWFGHFGAFHAQGWNFAEFAQKITAHSARNGRRACFLALGRSATASAAFTEAAGKTPEAEFHVLGQLSEEKVPMAIRACDAAFTSTPWDVIEKSSAVATWRALHVPVLATRTGATDSEKLPAWPDPGVFLASADGWSNLPAAFGPVPGPPFLNPENTTRTFLSSLISASASRP
jgi:hypothetical protein